MIKRSYEVSVKSTSSLPIIIAICLLVTPHLVIPDIIQISNLPKTNAIIFLNLIGIVTLAISHLNRPKGECLLRYDHSSLWILALYLFYTVYVLWGLTWCVNKQLCINNLLKMTACYFPLVALCFLKIEKSNMLLMMKGLSIGAASCAFIALYQWLTSTVPDFMRAPPSWSFLNKNFTASYCTIATFPSLALWILATRSGSRYLWLLMTLLNSLFVFHAFARASWLGLLAGVLLFSALILFSPARKWKLSPGNKKRIVEILIFSSLFFAGTFINNGKLESRLGEVSPRIQNALNFNQATKTNQPDNTDVPKEAKVNQQVNSFENRLLHWENIVFMAKSHFPIGVAEGNFQIHYPRYDSKVNPTNSNSKDKYLRYAHNEYLEIVSELGVAGIIILLVLLFLFLRSVKAILFNSLDKGIFIVNAAALASLTAMGLICMASSALHWPVHNYALALLVYLALPKHLIEKPLPFVPSKLLIYFLIPLCGIGIFLTLKSHLKRVQYERTYQISGFYFKNGDRSKAYNLIESAALIYPYDQLANQQYANLLCAKGDFKQSITYAKRIAKVYPYDFRNNYNLATALIQTGQRQQSIEPLERCLEVDPIDLDVTLKLSVALRETNWERSNLLLDGVIASMQDKPLVHILKAENLMLQERENEAAMTLIEAGNKYPGNKEIEKAFNDFGFKIYSIN